MDYARGPDRRLLENGVGAVARGHDRRLPGSVPTPLFQGVEELALLQAIGTCEVIALAEGDVLLSPGSANTTVYLLLSGQLGVFLDPNGPPGKALPIGPGELLGELSAIDGKPVSALVKAVHDARVLKLPEQTFWHELMSVPGVARNLLRVLVARTRRNTEALLESQRRQIELDYLKQELGVARQLQTGMLPLRQPMFPDRLDLDICGFMDVASAVGGDLFDAFFVDADRLFFCVGDVSGHGIPAAMFMARTVSLIRVHAFGVSNPAELLSRVNTELCAGNEANMFVSMVCGVCDLSTGELVYSNAGHLAPLWLRGAMVTPLDLPAGPIAGVFPQARYQNSRVVLEPGDTLLCFTDGVTEAHNPAGDEFSEPRLSDWVQRHANRELDGLLKSVRHAVAEFTARPDLDDDCTMLALRRIAR